MTSKSIKIVSPDELVIVTRECSEKTADANDRIRKVCKYIKTGAQLRALNALVDGSATMSAFAEYSAMLGPAASRLVPKMVKLGLIKTKESPVDCRVFEVSITAKGRAELGRYNGQ